MLLELAALFIEWEDVKKDGSSSPRWTDGQELNFIRGKIIRKKEEVEQFAKENKKKISLQEVPWEMPYGYMVKADEIKENALISLEKYVSDENYKYILRHAYRLNNDEQYETGILCVFNKMKTFVQDIEHERLVKLKAHESAERFLKEIRECREKLDEMLGWDE